MFDQDFTVASLDHGGEFFSPFHQENGVFGSHLIEADGLELALVFDAVKIDVVELDVSHLAIDAAMAVVFVNQGKGWAGYLVRIGSVEGLRDSLHQSGLARTQISAKKK